MSSLTRYYKPLELFRKPTINDSFNDSSDYEKIGNYRGFIQPISGGETFRDGKGGESATHRLYTGLATPIFYGDRITQNNQNYTVLYGIQPEGISSVEHHKEIILAVFE